MRYFILAVLLIGAVSANVLQRSLAPLIPLEDSENDIPDEYIVIFKNTASELDVQYHMDYLNSMLEATNGIYQVQHVYDMGPSLRGYAASMNEEILYIIRSMQEVDFVEKNQYGEWAETDNLEYMGLKYEEDSDEDEVDDTDEVEDQEIPGDSEDQEDLDDPEDDDDEVDDNEMDTCKVQKLTFANWALSRISHKKIQSRKLRYRYFKKTRKQGRGVNIYIVDSGIDVRNRDFQKRAKWAKGFRPGHPQVDTLGHGTNVAGCAMSKTYGAAKKARAFALAIDRNGRPVASLAIAAFNWVRKNQKKNKSIANASFHVGELTKAVKKSVAALVKSGVPLVVAAGNEGQDACNFTPASSKKVITVAASDRNDNFATFSNFGKCVNLIAPGVRIQTTALGNGDRNPTTTDGTSFSAPYTCGILATIMSDRKSTTPQEALQLLQGRALKNKVKNVPKRTTNRLLNSRC